MLKSKKKGLSRDEVTNQGKVTTPLLKRATRICVNGKKFFDMKLRESDVIKNRIDFYVKDMRK